MTKFRKGDRVLIEGVIIAASPVEVTVRIGVNTTCSEDIRITPHNAKMVAGGPPIPGDCVIHKDNTSETYMDNTSETYMVLAVDGQSAWVKSEVGHIHLTVLLSNLTVVRRC
jgi:hypothetical protein